MELGLGHSGLSIINIIYLSSYYDSVIKSPNIYWAPTRLSLVVLGPGV
jgi:hypothetical protein